MRREKTNWKVSVVLLEYKFFSTTYYDDQFLFTNLVPYRGQAGIAGIVCGFMFQGTRPSGHLVSPTMRNTYFLSFA